MSISAHENRQYPYRSSGSNDEIDASRLEQHLILNLEHELTPRRGESAVRFFARPRKSGVTEPDFLVGGGVGGNEELGSVCLFRENIEELSLVKELIYTIQLGSA
jgi:hypothetical protein